MDADHGAAGKFGIDEDQLFAYDFAKLPNIELIGIHVHARSQELHVEVLKKYYANMFALAQKCIDKLGMKMEFINMGGGIGVAYSTENDTDLGHCRPGRRKCRYAGRTPSEAGRRAGNH